MSVRTLGAYAPDGAPGSMGRGPSAAERIAHCAYRHWKAADLTEWPTVRQVAKRLGITNRDIEECEGDGAYITTSWNVFGGTPYGEHFVEAMTDEVDRAWDEYWKPYARSCSAECAS